MSDGEGQVSLPTARRAELRSGIYGDVAIWLPSEGGVDRLLIRPLGEVRLHFVARGRDPGPFPVVLRSEERVSPGVLQTNVHRFEAVCGALSVCRLPVGFWALEGDDLAFEPRVLEVGAAGDVTVQVGSPRQITGRVLDLLGAPCPGVDVAVVGAAPGPDVVTDGEGAFRLRAPEGPVFLAVAQRSTAYEARLSVGPFRSEDAVEIRLHAKLQNVLLVDAPASIGPVHAIALRRTSLHEPPTPLAREQERWQLPGPLAAGDVLHIELADGARCYTSTWSVDSGPQVREHRARVERRQVEGVVVDDAGAVVVGAVLALVLAAPDLNIATRYKELARSGVGMGDVRLVAEGVSGSDGEFSLEVVGDRALTLVASASGHVSRALELVDGLGRLRIELSRTHSIAGTIRAPSELGSHRLSVVATSDAGRVANGTLVGPRYSIEGVGVGQHDVEVSIAVGAGHVLPVAAARVGVPVLGECSFDLSGIDLCPLRVVFELRGAAWQARLSIMHHDSRRSLRVGAPDSAWSLPAGNYLAIAQLGHGPSARVAGKAFRVDRSVREVHVVIGDELPATTLRATIGGRPAGGAWLRLSSGTILGCDEHGVCTIAEALPDGLPVERVEYHDGAWRGVGDGVARLRAAPDEGEGVLRADWSR